MKTLKTNIALVVALLASVASVSAMQNPAEPTMWSKVAGYAKTAKKSVVGSVKAVDAKLFGTVASIHDDGNRVVGGLPVLRSIRPHYGYARATLVAGITAAIAGGAYKTYQYFTAPAEEAQADENDGQDQMAPVVDEPTVIEPAVVAPTPVVDNTPKAKAPKAKVGARNMKKSPKARAAMNNRRTAKRGVNRVAGCKTGTCPRRSK